MIQCRQWQWRHLAAHGWLLLTVALVCTLSHWGWAFQSSSKKIKHPPRVLAQNPKQSELGSEHEIDGQSFSAPLVFGNPTVITRRNSLASALGFAASFIPNHQSTSAADSYISQVAMGDANLSTCPSLTLPLQYQPSLSAYTISYKVGSSTFGAIIDTGSPFLLVPQSSEESCRPEYKWGCFRPEESRPVAGMGPTIERFDGNEGMVEWREGKFSFDAVASEEGRTIARESDASSLAFPDVAPAANAAMLTDDAASNSALFPRSLMTFGVISESLMDGPGGIFLGLVKYTDGWIRPSFLGQSDVSAFSIDLRGREDGSPKTLILYGNEKKSSTTEDGKIEATKLPSLSSIASSARANYKRDRSENGIPLVRDLNKRFGDPTIHYVGLASSIIVNGSNLASASSRKKLYCIFDTGCSGMTISPSLFNERYATARAQKEKSLWGAVTVELKTISGGTVTLNADRPITTPLGSESPWGKRLDGHLIVLGLAFLDGMKMTVDIDGDRCWFED
ncbi:hypothetical protein ACHAWF_010594 [Thalassiosira exigua]